MSLDEAVAAETEVQDGTEIAVSKIDSPLSDELNGIGYYLGAKVVVTGTFDRFGNFSQLTIRAIKVETAKQLTLYRVRINNNDVLADVTGLWKP
jgi:hypothetical protein